MPICTRFMAIHQIYSMKNITQYHKCVPNAALQDWIIKMTQVSAFIDSQRVFSFVSVHLSVSFLVSRLLVAVHPGWTATTDQIRVVNWIWPSLRVRRPRGPSVSAPAYIHDDCLLSSLWKISPNQRTGAANISPFRSKGLSASANTLVCEWLRAQRQFHYGIRLFLLQHDNHPPSHTQVNSRLCVRVITQCSVYSSSDSLILWMIMFVFTRGGLITTGGSSASFINTNNSGGNVKCVY